MSRFYLIVTIVAVMLVLVSEAAKPMVTKFKCDAQDKKNMDELVAKIMTYGRSDRKFPQNKIEFKGYCREQRDLLHKLEDYKSQCLKSRPKQIVSIIIYSIKSLINSYCKNLNSKKTKDLMASAVCANSATHDYLKCDQNYVDLLQAVENNKDPKKQLGQMCCGYIEIFKCIKDQAALHKSCTEERVEANSNYIRGFFDNAVQVICGDYNADNDKCDKFSLLRKTGKSSKAERPLSYFNSLVNVLSNL